MGFRMLIGAGVTLALALGIGWLWTSSVIRPISISLPVPPTLVPNTHLSPEYVERIGEGDLIGPESFAVDQGALFMGLADGRIVRLTHDEGGNPVWFEVLRTGTNHELCGSGGPGDTTDMENTCGRPLGLRITHR